MGAAEVWKFAAAYELPSWPFVVPPDLAARERRRYPVVIAGAGLAGLTLACDLALRGIAVVVLDEDRLRALAPDLDLEQTAEALRTVCDISQGVGGAGRPDLDSPGRRFGWLAAPRSTIVQPGPRHSGLTTDPAATLAELVDRLVRT